MVKLSADTEAIDRAVRAAVAAARARDGSTAMFVLAVSGGRDSMTMLDAFARVAAERVAVVATFDHGTGSHAADAVRLVAARCAVLWLRAVSAVAEQGGRSEAAWRDARWRFLRRLAENEDALVATAHTRDDHVETILMRELRGSGARGLAGLYAASDVVRPFLELPRVVVARAATARGLAWVEDPSNDSRAHLRNRVRHDLLPALLAVRHSLSDELLDIARRAGVIRATLDEIALELIVARETKGSLSVAAGPLGEYDPEALRALWPAIAAHGHIVLDRRGTAGLARFTTDAAVGDRMQLSGAIEVLRRRDAIVLRRAPVATPAATPDSAELVDKLEWGSWRFANTERAPRQPSSGSAWTAWLPGAGRLVVRAWRDGDRMRGAGDAEPRRVKRFLRDAGLVGPERRGWPVVTCGDEVVWIPGVRRSDAATVRSGRPEAVYVCERTAR